MKLKFKQLSFLAFSVLAVTTMISAPAFAVRGNDDSTSVASPTSTPKPSATPSPSIVKAEIKNEIHKLTESEVKNRVDAFNARAEATVKQLEAKKETAKNHTEQERKKSCEARSAELTKKLNKKAADSEKHKAVFDSIYTRVKALHDNKKLTTADYDALVAKADTAQQAASDSIAALKGFDTTVNCTDVTAVATKVAAFKEALGQTRDSLKAYRTAIKNLTVAVKASIPEASPTPSVNASPTPSPIEATPIPTNATVN